MPAGFSLKRAFLLVGFVVLSGISITAQNPKPAPAADDDVVKISTNVIQIDVSVTNSKGAPVTDLKPSEIEIYENGQKQKITGFTFVSKGSTPTAQAKSSVNTGSVSISVPTTPTAVRAASVRRAIAIVADDLNMSAESVSYTKQALKKFVDQQMQEGDLVAIIRSGAGIGALQQFTTDKRILYAAIDKIKWNLMGNAGASAFEPIAPTPLETLQQAGDKSITQKDLQDEKNAIEHDKDRRSRIFAAGPLGALRYVVDGMSEFPGRKSVLFFSDGFKLTERDRWGDDLPSDVLNILNPLIDAANRASVVLYAVDPRGIQYTGLTASDSPARPLDSAYMSGKMADRERPLFDTQGGLKYLSEGTGGFTIKNTNDLNGGVGRVLDDQSYYLIAYEPDADTFDATKTKFNKMTVKVLRKDVNTRYRSGFFGVVEAKKSATPTDLTPVQQLERALYSPFGVSGISLRLTTLFGSDTASSTFVRSLLHIDANNLTVADEKDGQKRIAFDVLAASFGDTGKIIDQIGKTYTVTVPPDIYKKVLTDGLVYHFKFPLRNAGPYQIRVSIRDTTSGRIGAANQFIEVPDLNSSRLTLSSVVIENLTPEQYESSFDVTSPLASVDPMTDTAVRRAKVGTVLRWGIEIYNASLDVSKTPSLKTNVRVYREGKLVLDSRQKPFDLLGQTDMQHLKSFGAIAIGKQMDPGDYILQVIVTDGLANPKFQVASQFVQFEVLP